MERRIPTAKDDYLFDLRGFLILRNCLSAEQLDNINTCLDEMPDLEPGEWHGYIHRQMHQDMFGVNYQQIYEAEAFRCLINHPAWVEYAKRYVGGGDNYDSLHGPLFIDENFANIRGPGQAISLHSGGHLPIKRLQYQYRNNGWACGQINILMALNDIGPGDGATMVIPGSHKAKFPHPDIEEDDYGKNPVDGVEGAIEVHLNAGDAVLFVDAISHGSAERVNPGERRICVFRYGPSWGNFRYGYQPSPALLESLDEEARSFVAPHRPVPGDKPGPYETELIPFV